MKKIKRGAVLVSSHWCCRSYKQKVKDHVEFEQKLASGEIVLSEPRKKRARITPERMWELEYKHWLDSQYFG